MNNTSELHFLFGKPSCEWIFPVYQMMALIFIDFPTGSGSSELCALLETCEYQVNWKKSNITQYEIELCILFLRQMYSIFMFNEYLYYDICFQIYFLIDHHCKTKWEFSDLLEKDRIDWTSYSVHRHHPNRYQVALFFYLHVVFFSSQGTKLVLTSF